MGDAVLDCFRTTCCDPEHCPDPRWETEYREGCLYVIGQNAPVEQVQEGPPRCPGCGRPMGRCLTRNAFASRFSWFLLNHPPRPPCQCKRGLQRAVGEVQIVQNRSG